MLDLCAFRVVSSLFHPHIIPISSPFHPLSSLFHLYFVPQSLLGDQVTEITAHLNLMNRRSKAVQMECQKMFLRLYFLTRVEEHDAIVYDLRDNGFLAYVPVFDFKGPVYLDRDGVVCLDPALLGLETTRVTAGTGVGYGVGNGVGTGASGGVRDGTRTGPDNGDGNGMCKAAADRDDGTNSVARSDKDDCAKYENRTQDLRGHECVLLRGEDDVATELLVCPKGGSSGFNGSGSFASHGGGGSASGSGGGGVSSAGGAGGGVLSIKPLQRIRVAMTSALFGNDMNSRIRLTLIGTDAGTPKTAEKGKKDDMAGHRLTEAVMEEKIAEKVKPLHPSQSSLSSASSSSISPDNSNDPYGKNASISRNKGNKENKEPDIEMQNIHNVSLYREMSDAISQGKNSNNTKNQKYSQKKLSENRAHLHVTVLSSRYELAGRRAFGEEDDVRLIFRMNRNKAIENEKIEVRKKEFRELNGVDESNKLSKANHLKSYDDKPKWMSNESKTELLLDQLKDGKIAAMTKMELLGEEWAEEEELPTSWESGEGHGADTALGLKASSGGMTKEISLATARQGKLRVAKKNSKY